MNSRSMYRIAAFLMLLVAVLYAGCAIPDDASIDRFVELVETLPKEERLTLKAQTKEAKTLKDLKKHPLGTAVVTAECRYKTKKINKYATGQWNEWTKLNVSVVILREVVICFAIGHSYADCLATAVRTVEEGYASFLDPNGPNANLHEDFIWECRASIEPQFSPEVVDGANEDVNKIQWNEVFDWLMTPEFTTPPAGIPAHVWKVLAPVLVPATAWGQGAVNGDYGDPVSGPSEGDHT